MCRSWRYLGVLIIVMLCGTLVLDAEDGKFGIPKGNEGTRVFRAPEHPYYSGEYRISGGRTTLVGSTQDTPPWDHLDYAGKHLKFVQGVINIEVMNSTIAGRSLLNSLKALIAIGYIRSVYRESAVPKRRDRHETL